MSLPNGFYPIEHTFGINNYRTLKNPTRELYDKYWYNDSPADPGWPVFVEGVVMPKSQAPRNWFAVGGLLDMFPRTVYYGGPITRDWAHIYVDSFQKWANSQNLAYETAIIPVQPDARGMRHPSHDFTWYIANESRPPTRYRYLRRYGDSKFHWINLGLDTWKYPNFHAQNPTVL